MTPDVADYDGLEFFIYLKFRKGVHLEKAVEKSNRVNRKVLEGYNTLKYTNREWAGTFNFYSFIDFSRFWF